MYEHKLPDRGPYAIYRSVEGRRLAFASGEINKVIKEAGDIYVIADTGCRFHVTSVRPLPNEQPNQ